MVKTPNLDLPYLIASQAQKHVTVNEALLRLDGMAQLVLRSRTKAAPDDDAADGDCYFVPTPPRDEFAGQAGKIALKINGGWVFLPCRAGARAYILDESRWLHFDGTFWVSSAEVKTPNDASFAMKCEEKTITLSQSATMITDLVIPQYAMVFGVTGRILTAFSGTLSKWKLGVGGALDRYANDMGLAKDSWLVGVGSNPMAYYTNTPLVMTAQDGQFAAGEIRLCLNYVMLSPPTS